MTKNQEAGHQDVRAAALEPNPDVLLHLNVPDELLKYYLSLARASGMVYALAIKQLINRMYRDHDYTLRRRLEGRRTGYDTALERDQQALAWLISAAALYVPDEVKRHPIPPRPPKPRRAGSRSGKAARARSEARKQPDNAGATSGERHPRNADMVAQAQALIEAARALESGPPSRAPGSHVIGGPPTTKL
jgi:hypothetical protein